MLALTKAGSSVALTPVPDPMPLSHEALVKVNAFSLNRGEVEDLQKLPEGAPVGWDFAGTLQAGPATSASFRSAWPSVGGWSAWPGAGVHGRSTSPSPPTG